MPSLPTVGGDNNTWGTILNDYLEVAHAADGTQLYPGASVLWAGCVLTGQASGTYPALPWVEGFVGAGALPASVGSDIAVNGGDATIIDILTTGWYQATLHVNFNPETGGDTLTMFEAMCAYNSSVGTPHWGVEGRGSEETSDAICQGTISTGPVEVTAPGGFYNFTGCFVSDISHLWGISAQLQVIRLA